MNISLCSNKLLSSKKGKVHSAFTILELVVVIAIMVTMLALAGNLLKNSGQGQSLQNSMQMVEGAIQEAQLEAKNRGTWARFFVLSDPSDTAPDTQNLRTYGVAYWDTTTKKWVLANRLGSIPSGFYISPKYSTPLETANDSKNKGGKRQRGGAFNSRDGRDTMFIPSLQSNQEVFFVEFDEEGRMSQPNVATRLVIVGGMPDENGDDNGMRPSSMDGHRPKTAAGIVIYPKGHIGKLRTPEQIVP